MTKQLETPLTNYNTRMEQQMNDMHMEQQKDTQINKEIHWKINQKKKKNTHTKRKTHKPKQNQ